MTGSFISSSSQQWQSEHMTGWHTQSDSTGALVYVDCNDFAALGVAKKTIKFSDWH